MVNHFITNEVAKEPASDTELASIRKELIFRHVAWPTALRHAMRQDRPRARPTRPRKSSIFSLSSLSEGWDNMSEAVTGKLNDWLKDD